MRLLFHCHRHEKPTVPFDNTEKTTRGRTVSSESLVAAGRSPYNPLDGFAPNVALRHESGLKEARNELVYWSYWVIVWSLLKMMSNA